MPRMFTLKDGPTGNVIETYHGFDMLLNTADRLAVCTFDGEDDIYAVDNFGPAIEEVKRKYREWYSRLPERIILCTVEAIAQNP